MKYVDEFRDRDLAAGLAKAIRHEATPTRRYHVMEFCGGHTHAIFRYGVQDLMPENVDFVHGPGCPVCVLPVGRIDNAIELAERRGVTLCSYGDMLRVPASQAPKPAEGESGRRRHPHGLFHRRCAEDRAPEPEPRGGLLRHRLRDDDAANGGRHPEGASGRASRISRFFAIMC